MYDLADNYTFQGKFVSAHEGEFYFIKAIVTKILISGIER